MVSNENLFKQSFSKILLFIKKKQNNKRHYYYKMNNSKKISLLIFILFISIKSSQQIETESVKSLIRSHLLLSDILNNNLMINSIKKKKLISRLKEIELILVDYGKKSKTNKINLLKFWRRISNEERKIKNDLLTKQKQKYKEKSASDHINSITGFWGR